MLTPPGIFLFEKPTAHHSQYQVLFLMYFELSPFASAKLIKSVRSILINWLLAVIDEFQQDDDVLFIHHLTVTLFDRFCSQMKGMIQTSDLQMIGAACAVLALNSGQSADEIRSSYFQRASFYTDGACTAQQIMDVSLKITDALQLRTAPPYHTACEQIDILLAAMQKNYASSSTYCLSHYLGELALQAETSLKFRPNVLGSAAYALACHTLGWSEEIWMTIIRSISDGIVSIRQLQPCMSELQGLLRQALSMLTRRGRLGNLPHIVVKYSRRDRQHVAKVIITPTPWPSVCPHGHDRSSGSCALFDCQQCEEEERATIQTYRFSRRSNHNAVAGVGSRSSIQIAGAIEGGEQLCSDELSAILETESSRDDVQTPVNAPHHLEERIVEKGFQRSHAKQGLSTVIPHLESNAVGQLQDVSFGAISDGNDNSFIVCPESIFDEDHSLLGPVADRRASLTSVLDAVDEEHDFCRDSDYRYEESQTDLDLSFEPAVAIKRSDPAWEASLERTMPDGGGVRELVDQYAGADPDMSRLTLL